MWLGIVFSIIYYAFGDFFTENFSESDKNKWVMMTISKTLQPLRPLMKKKIGIAWNMKSFWLIDSINIQQILILIKE
jgi:hypothetical protein